MHGTHIKIAEEMRCVYCKASTESSNGIHLNFIDVSVHTECPTTGHFDMGFLGFPVSSSTS